MLKFHLLCLGSHIKDATSVIGSRGHILPIWAPHYWTDSSHAEISPPSWKPHQRRDKSCHRKPCHLLPIWAPHYWLHTILMLKFHLHLGSQIKHAASSVRSRGHFCPSGLHTTDFTSFSCSNFTSSVLEATSKTRQVLSEAVATFCPSGLHTTDFTSFSCWNFTSVLEAKSNTRQVLSEAVATFYPSGLHTTYFTSFSCSNFTSSVLEATSKTRQVFSRRQRPPCAYLGSIF